MKLQKKDTNGSKTYNIEECLEKISGINGTVDDINAKLEKISGIADGAEVNQNAFSNVTVGSTTIKADTKTDTLTIEAGSNITLTPDATNDKITIAHSSYTARTGVPTANATPAFGETFKVSQPVSDTTGYITAINRRTITIPSSTATTSAAGLMSASDKTKLSAISDYITESGTSGGWTYRKWNSGLAECWGRYFGNVNAAANNWSGYYYSGTIVVDFPFAFKTLEAINFDGGSNDYLNFARNFASTLTQAKFLIIGHSADATNVGIDVSIAAKGRWK